MTKKSKAERKAEKLAKVTASKNAATTKVEDVKKEVTPIEEIKPEPQPEPKKEEIKNETQKEKSTEKPVEKPKDTSGDKTKTKPKTTTSVKAKIEEVEAEVVEPMVDTKPNKQTIAGSLNGIANGERIDLNHGVELMGMIHKQYVTNPDTPEELRKAMNTQFDAMAFIHLYHWNEQTKNDFKEAGIKVNSEMFNAMSDAVANALGITLVGLPVKEDPKQMKIDFEATMKDAPQEAKEAIEAEKKTKVITEVPKYDSSMTDEQVVENIRAIMSMHSGSNGMGNNLVNAVNFARDAFGLKDAQPAEILAVILSKLDTPHVLVNSFRAMAYGSLQKWENPFISHARFMAKLKPYSYTDKEVADIVRLFLANAMENNAKDDKKSLESTETAYEELFKAYNDSLINEIMGCAKDSKKVVKLPGIKGLSMNNKPIDCKGIFQIMKEAYGDLSDKLMKKQLQTIAALYMKPIGTVADYTKLS